MAANSEPLLNLSQAAAQLGMGTSTLRQKLYVGLGPVAVKLPGSDRWRFRPSDIRAYVRAGEISPGKTSSATSAAEELTN